MADPVRLAQSALEHFATRVAWQIFSEVYRARLLETAQLAPTKLHDFFRRYVRPSAHDHNRFHRLTPALVGHADHGSIGDRRVLEQYLFHYTGVDVLSAGHDHVFDSVLDV